MGAEEAGRQGGEQRPDSHEEAIAYLSQTVLPVLEESKAVLAKDGVTVVVETSWQDPTSSAEPMVSCYCGERGARSGTDLPLGDVVEFAVSNGVLETITAAGGRKAVNEGEEQQAIEDAVKRAVTKYLAELEDSVR